MESYEGCRDWVMVRTLTNEAFLRAFFGETNTNRHHGAFFESRFFKEKPSTEKSALLGQAPNRHFQPIIFRKSGLIGRTYAQGQASVITPDLSEIGDATAVKVRCIHRLCL